MTFDSFLQWQNKIEVGWIILTVRESVRVWERHF